MKNLALSLTAEDIQRLVTKAEADGKLICLEPTMYPLCGYCKRTIQQVLFDIMNASRITRVINRGIYIATSGWTSNGCVAIYFKTGDKWEPLWIDYEDTCNQFVLSYPEIKGDKLPYETWVEQNPDYSFWPEDDLHEAYDQYLYDGLSVFAIKILENQK